MRRSRTVWLAFAVCLAVVLSALGWVSGKAIQLDRAEAEARAQAALEENVRLALWRMDVALAQLVNQESARPYFTYSSFLPIERAYGRMFNSREGAEVLAPSPLLTERPAGVLIHFQYDPDGQLGSPQIPSPGNYDLAVPAHVSAEDVAAARSQLERIARHAPLPKLLAVLPEHAPAPVHLVMTPNPFEQSPEERVAQRQMRQSQRDQGGKGMVEFQERNWALQQTANVMLGQHDALLGGLPTAATDVRGVLMTPRWLDGDLVLARRVGVNGREYVQGCLLDWPGIKRSLLETIEDLLPEADLAPVADPPSRDEARMLAALPARLVPGMVDGWGDAPPSPILFSLGAAWACVLVAAAAVAVLLYGVVRLSERRAAFVTAVTHELRTPLTTFQMYAEMLAEDMIHDEPQRRAYLATLRSEAVRLTHLVENVLAYARLERGRPGGRVETLPVGELVGRMRGRLAGRAEQAGMELVVDPPEAPGDAPVRANPSAAEQVLFNLVDNACKYAAAAEDKRIHLSVKAEGSTVELAVADHGPGLAPAVRRRLFEPFSKTAQEAAQSAPGVGLGLALSRRLARDMGGDLRLEEDGGEAGAAAGARFVFSLPAGG